MAVVASFITVFDSAGAPIKVSAWLDNVTNQFTPMYSPDATPKVQPVSDNGGSLTIDGTVAISGGGGGSTTTLASGQVALSTTAAQVVATRATRKTVTVKNYDATIVVYIGVTGVTSATGYKLLAGEAKSLDTQAAVFAVAASGTPTVGWIEEFS